jgi:hypothetical protein
MYDRNHQVIMREREQFAGPVFLVGMPRSGTKLLRDLLNNHSQIAIAPNESHFIPHFYSNLERYGDLQDRSNFARFFRDFGETVFFRLVTKQRSFIDEQSWYDAVQVWTYAGVVEAFYRSYATTQHKTIWGDKTPFYLLILPLLRKLFPEARFVHIIRDARDYALSLKKGWGKNVLRSSQRWHDAVAKCRHDGAALKDDYLEVRYEQLVDEPASVLRNVCSFLSVPYEETMTTLKQPADKRGGDAKGSMDILKRNYGKWERSLSRNQIRRIEAICGSLLSDLGYPVTYRGEPQRILPVMMIWYQALDVLSLLRFEIRENGVAEAIRNMYRAKQYAPFRSVDMEEEE